MYKKRKSSISVKTIAVVVVKERRLYGKDLSPSFLAFCGDFEAYLARQIYHQDVSQAKENKTNGKRVVSDKTWEVP